MNNISKFLGLFLTLLLANGLVANTVPYMGGIGSGDDSYTLNTSLVPDYACFLGGNGSGDMMWESSSEIPTPIVLAYYKAEIKNGAIEISWRTESESNNAAFIVYRNDETIARIEGAGTSSISHEYSYRDNMILPGVSYTYMIADVDYANTETRYEDLAITLVPVEEDIKLSFSIGDACPNPFNPLTVIPFEINKQSTVMAILYDINGRKVRTLINNSYESGTHNLKINGSDLASGLYLVSIELKNTLTVRKALLLK